jgi:SAM-dependent MidA family methyltransferase
MLPTPDQLLATRSGRLAETIQRDIALNAGWIGFDQFMQHALYSPGLGYYSGPLQKFGEQGDFITAPMLGDLFAQCMGRQVAEVLDHLDGANVYEFGAGDGTLATDLLRYLEKHKQLPGTYFIVETSADLRQRQQQQLRQLGDQTIARVTWLEQLPTSFNGVIVGNELLDAMPCKRFETDLDGRCKELGVACENGQFYWKTSAVAEVAAPPGIQFEPGYQSERMLQAEAWARTIGAALESGVLLLIDYGFPRAEYYHPDRSQGTLMCHYRQHSHGDPFFWPGLQDITCHIDFTAIAEAGRSQGLTLSGYCDQANFLMSCGLLDILQLRQSNDPAQSAQLMALAAEVKKLTMPHEMGELFKVIALSRNYPIPLTGFSRRNLADRLGVV